MPDLPQSKLSLYLELYSFLHFTLFEILSCSFNYSHMQCKGFDSVLDIVGPRCMALSLTQNEYYLKLTKFYLEPLGLKLHHEIVKLNKGNLI